jgi:single-stranded DNA-specific DHH superfamily exonuclease
MEHKTKFKKSSEFLRTIKEKDNVIIVYNNDADGITSCVLVKKVLEKVKNNPYIISQPMPTEKNLIRKIQTTLPTKIIFLDLAIDQQQDVMKKIGNLCDILIIDHHQITKDMDSPCIVHYNPRFKSPEIYQSTAYCTYNICSDVIDMSDHLWIAAVGMIGDYNLENSQDLVKKIKEEYKIKERKLYDSYLGRIADMISAARATRELTCEEMVLILDKSKSLEDFEKVKGSEKMMESFKTIENEIMSIEQDVESNAEKNGDLIIYHLKSKYSLGSAVATRVSGNYMDKVFIIYSKERDKIHLSARNQKGNYDVAKILRRASSGLRGSAGGHDRAAGATIEAKDWGIFKERLINFLK